MRQKVVVLSRQDLGDASVTLQELEDFEEAVSTRMMQLRSILKVCDDHFVQLLVKDRKATESKDILKAYQEARSDTRDLLAKLSDRIAAPLFHAIEVLKSDHPIDRAAAREAEVTSADSPEVSVEEQTCGARLLALQELSLEGLDEQHRQELVEITAAIAEIREIQALGQRLTLEQEERLRLAQERNETILKNATQSRLQLTTAAKFKAVGAALTGAVLGGLIGGPIGALAGAKTVATIGAAAAGGSLAGGVMLNAIAKLSAGNASEVDEHYEARNPHS
jgi:hypothetical protein